MGFEELLVTHASPTLANMKPASLLSIANAENMETCMIKLEKRGLQFFTLANRKGQGLILVYRKDKLEKALSSPLASRILGYLGYPESIDGKLEFLRVRFLSTPCPHEVGLFLRCFFNEFTQSVLSIGLQILMCIADYTETYGLFFLKKGASG